MSLPEAESVSGTSTVPSPPVPLIVRLSVGVPAPFTVTLTAVECVLPLGLVPVIVTVYVPGATDAPTWIVAIEEAVLLARALPGTAPGLKLTEIPALSAELPPVTVALSEMESTIVLIGVTITAVLGSLPPWLIETLDGLADRLKSDS